MKFNSEILLKLSFLSGAIPFVGGWGIFLTWMLGRYLNASDFGELEGLGFIWMFLCFFIAIGGLFLLFVYVILNRKNLHQKMLFALVVILINIPSVYIVLEWQKHVDNMQFVKVTNLSASKKIEVKIVKDKELKASAVLRSSASEVLHYNQYDDLGFHDHYENDYGLKLIITGIDFQKEVSFSQLDYGACKQLIIDENFNVINEKSSYE